MMRMKKIILLAPILILALLTACTAPTTPTESPTSTPMQMPTVAPTVSPTQTPTPAPTPEYVPGETPDPSYTPLERTYDITPTITEDRSVSIQNPIEVDSNTVLPDYYPPLAFVPTKVWRAEPSAGEEGAHALMYMSDIENDEFIFTVYSYNTWEDYTLNGEENLSIYFTARAVKDGEVYRFAYDASSTEFNTAVNLDAPSNYDALYMDNGDIDFALFKKLSGEIKISDNSVEIVYTDAVAADLVAELNTIVKFDDEAPHTYFEGFPQRKVYWPSEFTSVSESEMGQVMYDMPPYYTEFLLPTDDAEVVAQLQMYMQFTYVSTEKPLIFRGINIGSRAEDVILRLPHNLDSLDTLDTRLGSVNLYGTMNQIMYSEGNMSYALFLL